ncbi:hypothetical protein HBB16_16380 [Pseudonocardia sp. MCCB 268]|nr:hypothetical protein [Pseudonocardia cytotoxica]
MDVPGNGRCTAVPDVTPSLPKWSPRPDISRCTSSTVQPRLPRRGQAQSDVAGDGAADLMEQPSGAVPLRGERAFHTEALARRWRDLDDRQMFFAEPAHHRRRDVRIGGTTRNMVRRSLSALGMLRAQRFRGVRA